MGWLTVSKAFVKSINTAEVDLPWFCAFDISVINWKVVSVVDLFFILGIINKFIIF